MMLPGGSHLDAREFCPKPSSKSLRPRVSRSDVGDRSLHELEGDAIDDGGDIHRKRISEDVVRKADRVSGCLVENLDCKRLANGHACREGSCVWPWRAMFSSRIRYWECVRRSRAWLECAGRWRGWSSSKEELPADIKRRKSACEDDEVRNGNGELINRKHEEHHVDFGAVRFFLWGGQGWPATGRIRHRATSSGMPPSVAEPSLRLQQMPQSSWPFSDSGDPFRRENSHQGRNELRSLHWAPRPVAARLPLAAAAKPRPEPGPPSATSSRPPLRGLSRSPSHSILSSTSSARFPLAHSPSPPHSLSLSLLRSVACERRRRQGIRKT